MNKVKGKYGEVVILKFNDYDMGTIKALAGTIISKLDNGIVFISNLKESSINFVCKASDSLKNDFNAGSLIKDVSKIAEGNGGGSTLFAQGGGVRPDKIEIIEDYVKKVIIDE